MTEREGSDNKEDLFEDLDKFFAPIQDVEWPETAGEEGEAAPAAEAEKVAVQKAPEPQEPEAQGGLFTGADREAEAEAPPAAAGPAENVPSETYETEEYISLESLGAPPPEYVGLPGPGKEAEEAELEEEPTPEAVEAAAEYFAEALREEAPEEPEPTPAAPEMFAGPEEVEEEILADLEEEAAPARTVRVGGAEGLGGPSWQEPTSVEVGAEHERRPTERDVPAAFLTGLVLAAVAIGSIAIGAGVFAVVAGVVVLLAQGELYGVMNKRHHQPATALGLASGVLVLAAGYFRGEPAMLAMVVLSIFATFLWYMAVPAAHRKHTMTNIGLTVLGVVYVPLLAAYALATLKLPDGRALVLSIVGLAFVYDTAAFILGYFWGSRPLAPTVSPKKSWEGAVAATLVVIAVSVGVVGASVGSLDSVARTLGLGIVVAVFATIGDLAESLLKRDLGVKDMGSILPGHGGVLDRIDSVLFVAPAAFLFLRLIFAR